MTADGAGTSQDRPATWAYAWWLLVGALLGLGIAALLTIGVILLALGTGLALIGLRAAALRNRSATATLAGVAAPALYLAWLNRGGPGEVCRILSGGDESCVDAWSPWPFVVVAALFVAASTILARLTRDGA
jgi:hypothetical protein